MTTIIKVNKRKTVLLALIVLVLLVRVIPHWGEFYARYVYPVSSAVLSWISSFVFFSLDEWIAVIGVFCLISYPVYAHSHHKKAWDIVKTEAEAVGWIFVWFYMGWGLNYHRDSFFERAHVSPKSVDKEEFMSFLNSYTDNLNKNYVDVDTIDKTYIVTEIQRLYSQLPEEYGLSKPKAYQTPKALAFNFIYSAAGVGGYIGPFADETHVNSQTFNDKYAFIYAHELSHLLSISNEAEAHYWAYTVCSTSSDKVIRYSGYYGILGNVIRNARNILTDEEYEAWLKSVNSRIIANHDHEIDFWRSQRMTLIDDFQTFLFNALLKGNGISSGIINYDEVLSMIIATNTKEDKK